MHSHQIRYDATEIIENFLIATEVEKNLWTFPRVQKKTEKIDVIFLLVSSLVTRHSMPSSSMVSSVVI